MPAITAAALIFFAVWVLSFRGAIAPGSTLREREILLLLARPRRAHRRDDIDRYQSRALVQELIKICF